jgi:hypothetical protein
LSVPLISNSDSTIEMVTLKNNALQTICTMILFKPTNDI